MMAIVIIILGLVSALAGSIMLLRFLSQFSSELARFNEIYTGEVHNLNSELRAELNELNYSYYDILDKQDERLSKLEKLTLSMISGEAPPFRISDEEKERLPETYGYSEAGLTQSPSTEGQASSEEGENPNVEQIKKLYRQGRSAEDIAGELGLGHSYVDLILSLYVRKGEE